MFDPAKPAPGDDLDAVLVRNQLNELKALIDAQAATSAAQAAQIASLQSQLGAFQLQVGAAIAGTANNIPGLGPLNLTIGNNPPQNWEVQPIADKLDQLINTLLRP